MELELLGRRDGETNNPLLHRRLHPLQYGMPRLLQAHLRCKRVDGVLRRLQVAELVVVNGTNHLRLDQEDIVDLLLPASHHRQDMVDHRHPVIPQLELVVVTSPTNSPLLLAMLLARYLADTSYLPYLLLSANQYQTKNSQAVQQQSINFISKK